MAQGERWFYDDIGARENPEKTLYSQNAEPGALVGHPQEVALAAVKAADTAQAAADAAQASADAAAALATNGVKPLKFYNFGVGSDQGWGLTGLVGADQDYATARRYTANAVNPTLAISGLSLAVADVNVIAVRLRLVSGTQGDGRLYYGNALHGVVDPYYANIGNLPVGAWTVLLFDFRTLADFMLNGPTSALSLRFGAAADLVVDVDWIALGQYGAVSQESVNDAQTTATNAATAAGLAQDDATEALGLISDMASDSLLSPVEKPALVKEMAANDAEYQGIYDAGTTFGNVTERDAFATAKTALDTYLAGLTTPVAWNVLTGNTTIVAVTFRQTFTAFYTARQVLLNKNADTARVNAATAQTTATNAASAASAAQTDATAAIASAGARNRLFKTAAAPTSPYNGYVLIDGDTWFNDDTTTNCPDNNCKGHTVDAAGAPLVGAYPHREKYWIHNRVSGAWVSAGFNKIVASMIDVAALSAIKADLGEVTAGIVRDVNSKMILDATNARIIFNTGTYMKVVGVGFGVSSQFIEWLGPTMAITACDKSNALAYVTTTGDAYFGGYLAAGISYNARKTTDSSSTASITVGPFGTVGGTRTVVCSYKAGVSAYRSGNYPVAVTISTTVTIYKSVNGGTETSIGTITAEDTETATYEPELGQSSTYLSSSNSVTMTDSGDGGSNITYRAAITSRTITANWLSTWSQEINLSSQEGTPATNLTPTCAVSYCRGSAQAIPNQTATIVDFSTALLDTDSAVTTGSAWKFTVPVGKGGLYQVSGVVGFGTVSASGNTLLLFLFKNGAEIHRGGRIQIPANGWVGVDVSTTLMLSAGDYIDFRVYQDTGASQNLDATITQNRISITRIPGY